MKHSNFVHLHLHTQYSLLDGAIRLDRLFAKAGEYRMPAVAMTDHGNIFGAIDFYRKAEKFGIKPVIGCEVYIAQGSRHDKGASPNKESACHLVLLVKNSKGYKNLCKLISLGYLEGFYYKPRIDKELLREHSDGLIAMSACLHGEIAQAVLKLGMDRALGIAEVYKDIFPDRRFFLELMDNRIPEQKTVNDALISIGRHLDIPLVATNDCHYLNRDEARAHDALLCIQTGKHIEDQKRLKFTTDDFYFKSPEEMSKAFYGHPDAIANTIEIAERCNLRFKLNEYHFPVFKVPEGEPIDEYFEKTVRHGMEDRLERLKKRHNGIEKSETYEERLNKELEIIKKMGYSGYFLIVSDFINYAKSRNIRVGPGRGSAAGSLVAYALGITDIDPIKHSLLFERFLNPERISMPDIDIDFCIEGRDEVISYVSEKYGKDNVAQIITFGTMKAKAVIRDVGRVMNMPFAEVDRIAKLVPEIKDVTIEMALEKEPKFAEVYDTNPKIKELIDIARPLEGLTRHASTHAAGVVISNRPIVNYMPLYKGQKDETIISQFDMKSIEALGLLKFDFLGLKTLTVINRAIELIKENRGEDLDISGISEDDDATYDLLCSGATNGVFQLESSGIRELLVKACPRTFEDIIAVVALYRPGPLESGMVDDYIERKHGRKKVRYELPQLKGVLENTYGVIVYQEQVMQLATLLANYSAGEADILRKAMGKKIPEVMEEQKERFLNGAKKNRIPPKKAEKIFDLIAKFAGYGFNKSHSAAYALIAYQTAYLKAHYPIEFMTALMTFDIFNVDKVIKYMGECREMGIDILPPDINESFRDFTISKDKIRFGLAAVKNVGDSAIDMIIEGREKNNGFDSLMDFCQKVDLRKVNKRVVESLIKSGAFDFTGSRRSQLFAVMDRAMETGDIFRKDRETGQINMFDKLGSGLSETASALSLPDIEEWPEPQLLAFEKEALGFYISKHPLERYLDEIKKISDCDTESIGQLKDKSDVKFCGLVSAVKEILTKKGERMAFVTLEDTKGFLEVVIFSDVYSSAYEFIKSDSPLVVCGTLSVEDDRVKIIAKDVFPLSEAAGRLLNQKKSQPKVTFKIETDKTDRGQLEAIKEVFSMHPGMCRVYLHLGYERGRNTIVELPEELKINPTAELGRKVKEILGYDPTAD